MSRATRPSSISTGSYRNFAIIVIVAAVAIALFTDDGGQAPARNAAAPLAASPARALVRQPHASAAAFPSEEPQAEGGDDDRPALPAGLARSGTSTDPAMMRNHTAPGMPRAGTFAPMRPVSQAQIQSIVEASRLRSGSDEGGD